MFSCDISYKNVPVPGAFMFAICAIPSSSVLIFFILPSGYTTSKFTFAIFMSLSILSTAFTLIVFV